MNLPNKMESLQVINNPVVDDDVWHRLVKFECTEGGNLFRVDLERVSGPGVALGHSECMEVGENGEFEAEL